MLGDRAAFANEVPEIASIAQPWDVGGDAIMDVVGDARFVLIGEASHGTEEFYRDRAELTRRLITEKGFRAVAVEADWPDAYRVNRFVRGDGTDQSADEALSGFRRFPQWMWRNTVVVGFVDWLREHNRTTGEFGHVGFYGLDLYSLSSSMAEVVTYLERVDPGAADRARGRYGCFDHYSQDGQQYGYAASFGEAEPCEDAVVAQLTELRERSAELVRAGSAGSADEHFHAEQNARLARNAEAYYRSMFRGRDESWNLRDRHMGETLRELAGFLDGDAPGSRIVVWAHNSHLGDARATEMSQRGELNLGQLVREWAPDETVLIGFSTHSGTVSAARDWGDPVSRWNVRPGLSGSWESLFHRVTEETGVDRFLLTLRGELPPALGEPRLQRAIGVIYRPDTERWSHYYRADLARQFDAMIHIDRTTALTPLERTAGWDSGEPPETYPSAL
jgi:erythromycin esterase-like protein